MYIRLITIISFVFVLFACESTLNRDKEALWVDIPYSINRGLLDSCSILSFVTQQNQYDLVNCVTRIGLNDNYIIVESYDKKDSTQYWIINKSIQGIEKIKKKENVEGPLDLEKFTNRKRILNISNLEFTKDVN